MIATRSLDTRALDAREIRANGGTLVPLPGRLFNAENLCMTEEGRLFVTGGETVAEIEKAGQRYTQIPIHVHVGGVPRHCMMSGIAARGDFLYLACVHLHQGNNPFLPSILCDINKVEQTGMGLVLTYLAGFACAVESYIVRAAVRPGPIEFTQLVARLPGKFLANGLAVDEKGEFLYVANSVPAKSAGIYRVPATASLGEAGAIPWCRPRCMPNGIKVRDGSVYFTGNIMAPVMSAVLGTARIEANGSAAEPQDIYRADFSLFDDFDVTDNGFVIAEFSNYRRSDWLRRFGAGMLRFLAKDGSVLGVVNHDEIAHPSAVAVVRKSTPSLDMDADDLLVTDKGHHRVTLFKPDDRCSVWLQDGQGPAVVAA